MPPFKELDVVHIVKLTCAERAIEGTEGIVRQPQVGDTGTVLLVLEDLNHRQYLVECVDPSGYTVWIADFEEDELNPDPLVALVETLLELKQVGFHTNLGLFDVTMAEISAVHNPRSIGPLLRSFEDGYVHEELLFAILHFLESFGSKEYITHLVPRFAEIVRDSPRWAQIILGRILNHGETLEMLLLAMNEAPDWQKGPIRYIAQALAQRNSRFADAIRRIEDVAGGQ